MTFKTLTSLQHPLVKHLAKLRSQPAYRREQRRLVLEGRKLLEEMHPLLHIEALLVADESLVPERISFQAGYLVTEGIIRKITGTLSPEGIVAEVRMPPERAVAPFRSMVVLDRLQDPGNVGTLMRTALAFGWDAIFCIEGTCDLWNDKVIRASRGAPFQLPVYHGSWDKLGEILRKEGATAYAADLSGAAIESLGPRAKAIALVLGNEGRGLSEEAFSHCQTITIPIDSRMESLNVSVAGGILMYLLRGENGR